MDRCPYCGATLQQQAQFCLHCMRSLTDKPDVTPRRNKKKWPWLVAGLCVLIGVILAVVLWPGEEAPQSPAAITTYEDFSLRAVYLSGKDSLTGIWDPDSLTLTHTVKDPDDDLWEIYKARTHMEGVAYQTGFCAGGIEVLTAITGLTEETYEEGLLLAECTISAVFNYRFSNLEDMLRDSDIYPRTLEEQDLLSLSVLPDPAADQWDAGTQLHTERVAAQLDESEHLLYVDVRTRTWQGQQIYDILILCTQDFHE